MTDEEPFIRAIVDSPGDETPRMVYADWLEERGDPRGAYLRAEQEAARTGDTSKIQELAAGLDPVWVARVTLPPLGVCCEHVQIRERGPAIDAYDIKQFEQRFDITLPNDYRAFLLNYNGGIIDEFPYETPSGEIISVWGLEHEFCSLKSHSKEHKANKLEWRVASRGRYLARDFAEFGPDPDLEAWYWQFIDIGRSADPIFGVLLGVAGDAFGQVRYFDYSVGFYPGFLENLGEPQAASFAEFLSTFPNTGYP
jgi:uncharacterized protein (TIGR02996 family)